MEGFDIEELQFSAEDELVTIIPSYSGSALHLMTDTYGPFEANLPVEVPLWMALTLRKKERCIIKTPSWLEADQIESLLQEEKKNESGFTKLPFHYFEIGTILLRQAKDDIENRSKIRRALEDLRSERFYKVRAGLKSLEGRTSAVKLNNLSALEINMIRGFFVKTLDAYQRYDISEVDWRNEHNYPLDSSQTPQGTPARGHRASPGHESPLGSVRSQPRVLRR